MNFAVCLSVNFAVSTERQTGLFLSKVGVCICFVYDCALLWVITDFLFKVVCQEDNMHTSQYILRHVVHHGTWNTKPPHRPNMPICENKKSGSSSSLHWHSNHRHTHTHTTPTHSYWHTHTDAHTHSLTHIPHTHTHTDTHTQMHSLTHTHSHTYHTPYTHTDTHTSTLPPPHTPTRTHT